MKLTKKQKDQERIEAIGKLKSILKQGQTVYTSLKSVSSSGMSRKISVYVVEEVKDYDGNVNHEINDITWLVVRALDYKRDDKTGGLVVSGTGMDMGFHVVYGLNNRVFDDGYATKQRWL